MLALDLSALRTLGGLYGPCNFQYFFCMQFWLDVLENFLDDAILAD
jgi:hypothetical protein